jgi:hypothetical protein
MNEEAPRKVRQCSYVIYGYRIGRAVAEHRQCKRKTSHPSGKCSVHRSDWENE